MKGKLQVKDAPRKGTRRVEAWVYTVINPLIEALRVEKSFLRDKNWTWRYETKDLEFILSLERYINSSSLPNFEDFVKAKPQLARKTKNHDDLRVTLSENCQMAFDYLVAEKAFQGKVKSALTTYEKGNPAEGYPGGAVPREHFRKLIAQYIVNWIKELPSHYSSSKFWSRFGNEFFQFRTGEAFEKLDTSGEQFENEDEIFLKALENLRSNLVEKYDIPAAPISDYSGWSGFSGYSGASGYSSVRDKRNK